MSQMFDGARTFNQTIERWNTANVLNMTEMFKGATAFKKSIALWNVQRISASMRENMFQPNLPQLWRVPPMWRPDGINLWELLPN